MPGLRRAALLGAMAWALTGAGCALLQPTAPVPPAVTLTPPPPPPPPPVVSPSPPPPPLPSAQDLADAATRAFMAFHEDLRNRTPAELGAKQARLEAALGGQPPAAAPAAALQLAQLLGRLGRDGDLARALMLTELLSRDGSPAPWQPAARWLHSRLLEQRAQDEQVERLQQLLREQQRRLDQLQAQIEALRAIERSLGTRPLPP